MTPPEASRPGRRAIRALVIDDEALVRAGLRLILESAGDITVVGEAADGADAVDAVRRCRPDVVLMDVRMPRLDGLAATVAIRELVGPRRPSSSSRRSTSTTTCSGPWPGGRRRLPAQGHAAPRPRAGRARRGRRRLDALAVGHPAADRPLRRGHRAGRRQVARDQLGDLSPREREVLAEVGRGLSNAEIGATLFMSEATVKAHVSHLFVKLDRSNRVQLAILAHDAGLTD